MRRKVKTRRNPAVLRYTGTLTEVQFANLRFRDDLFQFAGEERRQVFASEEERRQAYLLHRDRVIGRTNTGTRPASFWRYEPKVPEELRSLEAWVAANGFPGHPEIDPAIREFPHATHVVASKLLSEARRGWLAES